MKILFDQRTLKRLRRAAAEKLPPGRKAARVRRRIRSHNPGTSLISILIAILFAAVLIGLPMANKVIPLPAKIGLTALNLTAAIFLSFEFFSSVLRFKLDTTALLYTPAPLRAYEAVADFMRRKALAGPAAAAIPVVLIIAGAVGWHVAEEVSVERMLPALGAAAVLYLQAFSALLLLSFVPRFAVRIVTIVTAAAGAFFTLLSIKTNAPPDPFLDRTGAMLAERLPAGALLQWAGSGPLPARTLFITGAMCVLAWPAARYLVRRFRASRATEAAMLRDSFDEESEAEGDAEAEISRRIRPGAEQLAAAIRRVRLDTADDGVANDDTEAVEGDPAAAPPAVWLQQSEELPLPGLAASPAFQSAMALRLRSVLNDPGYLEPDKLFLPPQPGREEWSAWLRQGMTAGLAIGGASILFSWLGAAFVFSLAAPFLASGTGRAGQNAPAFALIGMGPGSPVPLYGAIPFDLELARRHSAERLRRGWRNSLLFALLFPAMFCGGAAVTCALSRSLDLAPGENLTWTGSMEAWLAWTLVCLAAGFLVRTASPLVLMRRMMLHVRFCGAWRALRALLIFVNVVSIASVLVGAVLLIIAYSSSRPGTLQNSLLLALAFIALAEAGRWFAARFTLWLQRRGRFDFGA